MKDVHKYNHSIIYFGGTLHPPDTFKNKKWYENIDSLRKSFQKNKFNTIDSSKYRILGGHGYYFPTWKTVDGLLKELNKKKKLRALDSEMVKLQKKGMELPLQCIGSTHHKHRNRRNVTGHHFFEYHDFHH